MKSIYLPIMLIEKCENGEERIEKFLKILDNTKDLKEIEKMEKYILNLQRDTLTPDVIEKLEETKKEGIVMESRAARCMRKEAKMNIAKGRNAS